MLAVPMGTGSFPSHLSKTNAILDALAVAETGLSCIPTTFSSDKGVCFSGGSSGNYLGPELHERGEGTLHNELVDPSGPLDI